MELSVYAEFMPKIPRHLSRFFKNLVSDKCFFFHSSVGRHFSQNILLSVPLM